MTASFVSIPQSYLNCPNVEAKECLNSCTRGFYINNQKKQIPIADFITNCLVNTKSFPPKFQFEKPSERNENGLIEIRNESTLAATYRLVVKEHKSNVCALNFANSVQPGGGFLNKARAQEETLCRSSALYYSLIQKFDFYQYHQNKKTAPNTASNYIIFTPDCPTWKTDNYVILDQPYTTSYITCAAVHNCGMQKRSEIKRIHNDRIKAIIDCAIQNGVKNFVLGAFGCGAFENNPDDVAQSFKQYFVDEEMRYYFESISFSIIGFNTKNIDAFSHAFNLPIV